MVFSRQECWSMLPCPPPGDLPNPGIKPTLLVTPALQEDSITVSYWRSPTMERGLIIKEDPYCSGRLLLWRGKIYNTGTLIPWGLLHRGGAMTIQRTIIIKGTITIEGDHSVEGDYYRSSVQFSRSVMSDSLPPHEPQHARPPCHSLLLKFTSVESVMLSTISSSATHFCCLQSFPASGSFLHIRSSCLHIRWPKFGV